jgi:signal transduction histidine kinase
MRVLVVDDIEANRRELSRLLRAAGHRSVEAANGRDALRRIQAYEADVVLLDLLMPDMDGFEATRRLRATRQGAWLPVVVMSSLEGAAHFVRAIEDGADDYLVKPIDPKLLDAKLRNIGQILELQSRLAALAAHNRELFDHVEDAVLTLDAGLRIRDANAAGLELLGCAELPGEGMPLDALMSRELAVLLSAPETAGASHDLVLYRQGRDPFDAEVRVTRWRDDAPGRISLVIRDLTERRHLERLKDEFLSTVSHELRTPLTSVMGAMSLLASGAAGQLPPPAQKLLDVACRNGERLGRLIDDVLDVTKLEADRMALRPASHPLDSLLDEALAAHAGYARRLNVTLRRVGPPCGLAVWADTDRFLQIMANLLSNAVKHSPDGGTVELRCRLGVDHVRVSVRDHGPGIADEFRSRLFEKFSQASGENRRSGASTGLGLHITRILAQRMGGRIGLVSSPGHGAEFHVDVPICRDGAAPPALAACPPDVWIVDRDAAVRSRLTRLLAPDCAALAAREPGELARAGDAAPALLVADPVGAGASLDEVVRRLREAAGPAPILLYSDAVSAPQAAALGCDYLPKHDTGNDAFLRAARRAIRSDKGPGR